MSGKMCPDLRRSWQAGSARTLRWWCSRSLSLRTSMSAHLDFNDSIVTERIAARVASVCKAGLDQVEPFAMVRYEPGQCFKVHHDGSMRSSTVFIYLNDVEGGGETYFPKLGYKVRPVARAAVMWHNRLPDGSADMRMVHEALPTTEGIKYGVNCFVAHTPLRDASHIAVTQLGDDSA
eukprot:TRINITY_DN26401_c0_g1_i2.p1 TRINITY_DN26401_c0_g1~~TRINITY_DN26401_c0_g1_i2.p1  ORF type:complete len:178 (-),score=25.21 TRINITY_DN26401_c0_g1_i2:73-606(-)